MSSQVAVVGGGRWGRSLAKALSSRADQVLLWTRSLEGDAPVADNVELTTSVADVMAPELVFLAIPPAHVRAWLKGASPLVRANHQIVHLVRGFEPGGKPLSQVITEETRALKTGALTGPIVPEEMHADVAGAAVVGSQFQEVIDGATAMLAGPRLRVYGSLDQVGVEVGSALRSPIGLAAGMARALSPGGATLAFLLTRSLAEGARLVEAMGGTRETLSGLAGMGDWIHTAHDVDDELVLAGMRLGRGKDCGHTEAAERTRTIVAKARSLRVQLPICEAVAATLSGTDPQRVMAGLMERAPTAEIQ